MGGGGGSKGVPPAGAEVAAAANAAEIKDGAEGGGRKMAAKVADGVRRWEVVGDPGRGPLLIELVNAAGGAAVYCGRLTSWATLANASSLADCPLLNRTRRTRSTLPLSRSAKQKQFASLPCLPHLSLTCAQHGGRGGWYAQVDGGEGGGKGMVARARGRGRWEGGGLRSPPMRGDARVS